MLSRRFTSIAVLLAVHVVVPALLILWVWTGTDSSQIGWATRVIISTLYIVLLFFIGLWGDVTYYLRYALAAVLLPAILGSYNAARELPVFLESGPGRWISLAIALTIVLMISRYIVLAVRGYSYEQRPIDLSFPFRNGAYAIMDGGNGVTSPVMNHHYKGTLYGKMGINSSTKYAADITKLNALATSARGLLPRNLESYAIFNELVYSPCDGEVVKAVDRFENVTPFSGQYPNHLGNTIVIRSNDACILICHLQKGSIDVKVGEGVRRGQQIARVGSSGWSDQPHLHIHATQLSENPGFGEGVPFVFDGRVPVRNRLFFK